MADLKTYLHDHLAGAKLAVEILTDLQDQHRSEPVRQLASSLLVEIKEDRDVLQQIITQVAESSTSLKEAIAWVAEKTAQLKLGHSSSGEFGTFESLEAVALGILGKLTLWKVLGVVALTDQRLRGFHFDRLASRAQLQHARVEQLHLDFAGRIFNPASENH